MSETPSSQNIHGTFRTTDTDENGTGVKTYETTHEIKTQGTLSTLRGPITTHPTLGTDGIRWWYFDGHQTYLIEPPTTEELETSTFRRIS